MDNMGGGVIRSQVIEFTRFFVCSPAKTSSFLASESCDKMTRIRAATRLNRLPIKDPVNLRAASLLQTMLIGLMAIVGIATVLNLIIQPVVFPVQVILLQGLFSLLVIGFPLLLLRRGHFHSSVFVIIAILLSIETFAILSVGLRSIAETLAFFTLAILLAGLLVGRRALVITFGISALAVIAGVIRESVPELRQDGIAIAGNFILLNGLICLFLDRFGITLREALTAALERENELKIEIHGRQQSEAALAHLMKRLELLHEIDRSLLSARSLHEIATGALARIRQLIPSPRASVTLFDFEQNEAIFLAADFEEMETIPKEPISLEEYGLQVIDALRRNQPWSTDDILNDPHATDLDKQLANERGIRAWLYLPLLSMGQLIGGLNLGRRAGSPFTQDDAEIAHDVANQLAIALEQTKLYDALQNELGERQKLIVELEASNSELERFTYTVSHDLRNPLVTIKGFLGMLEKDIREGRSDKIRIDLDRISAAADRMNELLSDLLELSRVGRILNPSEEINLVNLANDAVESLDGRLRARNITVRVSPDLPLVFGDRIRLRELFENLIDNAAKYMGSQPDPVIEIGVRPGSEPVIFIKDNGIGIEPQYQARIFTLFEQLNPGMEGTGIGLALVKRIIETHGGKIWVESDGHGRGSAFCFTIPSSSQTQSSRQSAPTD